MNRKVTYLPSVSEAELRDALAKVEGSAVRAAQLLGVHRATIYRLKRHYGIRDTLLSQPDEKVRA